MPDDKNNFLPLIISLIAVVGLFSGFYYKIKNIICFYEDCYALNEQYAEATNAVEVKETVLEELNKQTEETIQTMVETEAQKEFMRYAFLKEPKTTISKIVSGAWRKFKEWWDEHKRKAVEEKTRESVLGKLAELKKETAKQPRKPIIPKKNRGPELE